MPRSSAMPRHRRARSGLVQVNSLPKLIGVMLAGLTGFEGRVFAVALYASGVLVRGSAAGSLRRLCGGEGCVGGSMLPSGQEDRCSNQPEGKQQIVHESARRYAGVAQCAEDPHHERDDGKPWW